MMEKRLIDAIDLEAHLKINAADEWNNSVAPRSWSAAFLEFVDIIDDMPTIDAVEVVRCRNCMMFMEFTPEHKRKMKADGDCYFRVLNSMDERFCCVKFEDYCSMGKRKELFEVTHE